MRKFKKVLKTNLELIIGVIVGIVLTSTSVYAAILYQASQVGYDNSLSGLTSTNVQNVIDELNNRCLGDYYVYTVNTRYSQNSSYVTIGQPIPSNIPIYSNYNDAIANYGHPYFLRHSLDGNKINDSFVGFILDGNVYYLKGGVNETSLTTKPVYEANKSIIITAFGSSNCSSVSGSGYSCIVYSPTVFWAAVYPSGRVYASEDESGCEIQQNNTASCDEI